MYRFRFPLAISFAAIVALLTARTTAQTDTTTFTYQGRLEENGEGFNGPVNLDFALFDSEVGGNQIGSEIMFNSILVIDGLFTLDLDFGGGIFQGEPRFLEITVNGTELVPRQPINSAPYAIQSDNTRGIFVDDNNRVGIGTDMPGIDEPSVQLDVVGGSIRAVNSGDQANLLWLASDRSWVFRQEGTGAGTALKLQSIGGGGNKDFLIQTDGLVGIGTLEPTSKLDVAGDARITGPLNIANSQINLLSPVNRTYTVHHYDLVETDLGTGGFYSRTNSGLSVFGNLNDFACSVHLPDGATIVALEALGHDGSTSTGQDIVTTLGRTSFSGSSADMASVNSIVGGSVWQTTAIAFPVVNNNTHAYWLKVRLGGGTAPFDTTIFAVRILYRITVPLP
jgi:hypothetical protein